MYQDTISFKHIPTVRAGLLTFNDTGEESADSPVPGNFPPTNILETAADYLLLISTCGLTRDDIKVHAGEGILTIISKRHDDPDIPGWFRISRSLYGYPDWTRTFRLPEDADVMRINATFKNGELFIHIPRGVPGDNKATTAVYVY